MAKPSRTLAGAPAVERQFSARPEEDRGAATVSRLLAAAPAALVAQHLGVWVRDTGRVEVRVMRSAELDATLDVWRAASLARGRPGDGPRLALARAMVEAPGGTTYVAVAPDIVGMALIEAACGGEPSRMPAPVLQVSMVFVHPEAQRRGVGSALLRRAFEVARAGRVPRVQVWTGTDNPQAQRFYSSLGMVRTGRRAPGALSQQIQFEIIV